MRIIGDGQVEILGEPVDYTIGVDEVTEVRSLELERNPFSATELLLLMNSIAPVQLAESAVFRNLRSSSSASSRPTEAAPAHPLVPGIDQHVRIFKDNLELLVPHFNHGNPTIKAALLKVENSGVKHRFMQRYNNGEVMAKRVAISESGIVSVPDTPVVELPLEDGTKDYVRKYSLLCDDDGIGVGQKLARVNNRLAVTAILSRYLHQQPYPIWSTLRSHLSGVIPTIEWKTSADGSLSFLQRLPSSETTTNANGERWHTTHSSVAGSLVLAHLNPQVTKSLKRRMPLYVGGDKEVMGPIQSLLMAVESMPDIMSKGVIPRVESGLEEAS